MSRLREKAGYYTHSQRFANETRTCVREIMEDFYKSPGSWNSVVHISNTQVGSWQYKNRFGHTTARLGYSDARNTRTVFDYAFGHMKDSVTFQPSFQADDSFELLSFLAEFEEFLDVFTIDFWRTFSYGTYTWAALPLISDLRSLYASLEALLNGRFAKDLSSLNGSRCSRRFRVSHEGFYNRTRYTVEGIIQLKGTIRTPLTDRWIPLKIFLDELGVHPDVATVWNLIPLSFLVDYILPIGDILESIHPRGWFSPDVNFDGTASFSGTFTVLERTLKDHSNLSFNPEVYRCYVRYPESFTRSTRVTPEISFSNPSKREILNTAYIFREAFGRSRILGRL